MRLNTTGFCSNPDVISELEIVPELPYSSVPRKQSTIHFQIEKEEIMKNPLDSISGVIVSGLVLTLILYVFAANFLH